VPDEYLHKLDCCGQRMHDVCFDKLAKICEDNGAKLTCPLCRAEIDVTPMGEEEAALEANDSDDNEGERSTDEEANTDDENFIIKDGDVDMEGEYVPPGGIKRKRNTHPSRRSKRSRS
jgi:hypothetical protein